ncbi:MAG: hypothetical protein JNM58_07770 [Xanthomonadaceae bacterium]|nr:hypothetical protein [Xanthomonadaceae bacterium]
MRPEDIRLEKTEKARGVLASTRASGLGVSERRILILADGRRSLADIAGVLGGDILPAVQALVDQDYLARARPQAVEDPPPGRSEQLGERLGHLLRGASLIRQARPRGEETDDVAPDPRADDIVVLSGRSSRASPLPREVAPRSIISAKSHAVDLLALHADPRLVAAVEAIRKARGESDVARTILEAVATLRDMGEPQLVSGTVALLDPLMPERFLPALRALDRTEA